MPAAFQWIVWCAFLIGLVALIVEVHRLRREVRVRARRDAETERQVQHLISRRGVGEEDWKDWDGDDRDTRKHIWPVPPLAALAGILPVLGWLRTHSGPIGATVAGATAVTVLFIAGSSTSDTHRADPPRPVVVAPTDAPLTSSSTSNLPPAPTTTTTSRPAAVESVAFVPTTTTAQPSTATTTTSPTGSTNVPLPPTSTMTPSPSVTPCLLRVQLLKAADLCVST